MESIKTFTDLIKDKAVGVGSSLPRQFDRPKVYQVERRTLSELDITHPTMQAAVKMCHSWAQRKRDGYTDASVVLMGPVGTGKTHIAKSLLWSIAYTLDDGEPVGFAGRFFVGSDLLMLMSPARNDYGITEIPRPFTFIGNVPIVVIDDIGTEQNLPFVKAIEQEAEIQARYFRVIDYCYSWQISLVITSNLSMSQLTQVLGPRSWDRLGQMAPMGYMIDLTGVPSWRQKNSGR